MRKKGQKISTVKAGIETQAKINLCSKLVLKYTNLGQYFDLIDARIVHFEKEHLQKGFDPTLTTNGKKYWSYFMVSNQTRSCHIKIVLTYRRIVASFNGIQMLKLCL